MHAFSPTPMPPNLSQKPLSPVGFAEAICGSADRLRGVKAVMA